MSHVEFDHFLLTRFRPQMKLRHPAALGCAGLLMLSGLYCLPRHPSASDSAMLDALAHVALFTGIGAWFGRFVGRRARVFIPLIGLAALLEVAQWRIGGYARIEWPDIIANEAGLALAALWLWRRPAFGSRQ
jgi:hypothetical protein